MCPYWLVWLATFAPITTAPSPPPPPPCVARFVSVRSCLWHLWPDTLKGALSFHIASHVIFNQTKATSEDNTHVNRTIQEDRAEETQGGSVTEDVSLWNKFELILPYIKQNHPAVNDVGGGLPQTEEEEVLERFSSNSFDKSFKWTCSFSYVQMLEQH